MPLVRLAAWRELRNRAITSCSHRGGNADWQVNLSADDHHCPDIVIIDDSDSL
jgi:hypothetical protein